MSDIDLSDETLYNHPLSCTGEVQAFKCNSLQTYLLNSVSTDWVFLSITAVENKNMFSLVLCFSKPFDYHSLPFICIVCAISKGTTATGAVAFPSGLHFKGDEPFPRFTSKQPAPVPLLFFYVLWRTAQCYQQHWKNTLKPGLLPCQRALHAILNLVPLTWEVNGYLWDCRLYKAKHTLTIHELNKASSAQLISQEILPLAALKPHSPSLLL